MSALQRFPDVYAELRSALYGLPTYEGEEWSDLYGPAQPVLAGRAFREELARDFPDLVELEHLAHTLAKLHGHIGWWAIYRRLWAQRFH